MVPTIAAQISQQLAEDIISGVLSPGEKLEEPALAQRFQVSRTPVREALRLLDARGLIELAPRRGESSSIPAPSNWPTCWKPCASWNPCVAASRRSA
ncbi:winged helix-turn-helix domain-containing protein [Achromobacter xylosoxidans]